jgi:hypothetical protein
MTPTQVPLYLALHRLMDDLGFRVHDCTGPGKPLGGVCLHPPPRAAATRRGSSSAGPRTTGSAATPTAPTRPATGCTTPPPGRHEE